MESSLVNKKIIGQILIMETIYPDNRKFFCLPQTSVVSRIKNLGQNCKGGWGNLVHFLGTCPIIFFHEI